MPRVILVCSACLITAGLVDRAVAQRVELKPVAVESQPLSAAVRRVVESLEYLGAPLPPEVAEQIRAASVRQDADQLQRALDPRVTLVASIANEASAKLQRGPAESAIQQAGFVPVLIKVINPTGITGRLQLRSPQSGAVYAGVSDLSMKRQRQQSLRENENVWGAGDRFLQLEMFESPPMASRLSGLPAEYVIALVYTSKSGELTPSVSLDLVRDADNRISSEVIPLPLVARPAVAARLSVKDTDGEPTIARLLFRDKLGNVYPPQPKRLAPDLFFQPHVYRGDGEMIVLPPGKFSMQSSRGPEYRVRETEIEISPGADSRIDVALERWINPMDFGFYCGDHHIHAAGCAHYTSPTEGVSPGDMFRQVKGEGLNVGCVLTWGPCFDFQHQFFAPTAHELSEPRTLMKYDLEISGFGSQALGHVCLLGLKNQTYPGSESTKGWPTWTTPVMHWAKQQGAITGYAHSASGLAIDPAAAAKRLLAAADNNKNGQIDASEAAMALLPEDFSIIDADRDGEISIAELTASHDRAAEQLPNLAVPEMNGVGAMEICVSTAEGVCDFISAMDTPRIQEWNCWYHLLNCGFPLKVSGETDFPCMSSRSVGQGRVYVQLGNVDRVSFSDWCAGLAAGRSYVSDGYAHAVQFTVNGQSPGGDDVRMAGVGPVKVYCKVAFAPETPLAVAYGGVIPPSGRRLVGDTVELHGERREDSVKGGQRLVELVMNGAVVGLREIPAEGKIHDLDFEVEVQRSSWIALRHFPQFHTNPVNVIVTNQPIRASRRSALWCEATIHRLWDIRQSAIAAAERQQAKEAFDRAIERYRQIANESPDHS